MGIMPIRSNAQESTGGIPPSYYGFNYEHNTYMLPDLNNEYEQLRADSISSLACESCENNNYYGRGIDVSIDIKEEAMLHELEDGSKLWKLKISSQTAYALQFYFDEFYIPDGGELYFYNSDSTEKIGAFTSKNNPFKDDLLIEFGTIPITGREVFIEYIEPEDIDSVSMLVINRAIHVFSEYIGEKGGPWSEGGSLPCNINVSCSLGNGWEDEISSVALVLGYDANNDLTAWCSGALVNNTDEDGIPFFLTAFHCINKDPQYPPLFDPIWNPNNWLFLFNHEAQSCNDDGSNVSNFLGQSVFGSLIRESDQPDPLNTTDPLTSDFLLLELNTSENTLSQWSVCYSGWTKNISSSGPFVGIHHPNGDVKKISNFNGNLESTDYGSYVVNPTGNYWKVSSWTDGTTEGISSGSPLFNEDHRVVGQLTGGLAACNNKADWYGKFTKSWQEGGFGFWLDPSTTGVTHIDTYCPTVPGGGTGGGGTGGGSYGPCYSDVQTDGFSVNGSSAYVSEVCLNEPIIVSANMPNSSTGCLHNWGFKVTIQEKDRSHFGYGCSNLYSQNPYYCSNYPINRCNCWFKIMYIAIDEVNSNLVPISPGVAEWVQFGPENRYGQPPSGTGATNKYLHDFNLLDYLSNNMTLYPGKFYQIKIATAEYSGWREGYKVIHTYSNNLNINNTTVNYNLLAQQDISIQNSTINQNINVVAGNSISINSNSTLLRGSYKVDQNISCSNVNNYNPQHPQGFSRKKNQEYNANQQKIDTIEDDILIYPNPSNGEITIQLTKEEKKSRGEFNLLNINGVKVLSGRFNSPTFKIDINDLNEGIYLIKIISQNKTITKRIIKY